MKRSRRLALLSLLPAFTSVGAAPATRADAARPAEALALVVHSALNCPLCKVWRESSTGMPLAQQMSKKSPAFKIVYIERPSVHGSETESMYPPELKALYQSRRERYQLSPPTPLFELVRDGQVVSRQAGLRGWSEGILPELQQIQSSAAAAVSR